MIECSDWTCDHNFSEECCREKGPCDERIIPESEKPAPPSVDSPAAGWVSQEMLNRAMKAAVQTGLIPKEVDIETYTKNWDGMRACLEAALAE